MSTTLPDARQVPATNETLHRVNRFLSDVILHLCVLAALIILLLPIAWMLSTSFKPLSDVFNYPPEWIPLNPTLENYVTQFTPDLRTYFFNSVIIGFFSAILATGTGALAAYGLTRFRFFATQPILLFFLASLGFPIPLLMISMYLIFVDIGLLNTYTGMVIGHTVITLPVCVWLLKNFFDQLPVEVEEAALVDGASRTYTLFRIVLPMARPAMGASAIFVFVTSWNELLFGLTFVSSSDLRPLPAGISMTFLTEFEGAWSEMMALSLMVSIPIFLLFVFFKRTFMQGVTSGTVKG